MEWTSSKGYTIDLSKVDMVGPTESVELKHTPRPIRFYTVYVGGNPIRFYEEDVPRGEFMESWKKLKTGVKDNHLVYC